MLCAQLSYFTVAYRYIITLLSKMGLCDFLTLILEVILVSIMMHYAVNFFYLFFGLECCRPASIIDSIMISHFLLECKVIHSCYFHLTGRCTLHIDKIQFLFKVMEIIMGVTCLR